MAQTCRSLACLRPCQEGAYIPPKHGGTYAPPWFFDAAALCLQAARHAVSTLVSFGSSVFPAGFVRRADSQKPTRRTSSSATRAP